MRVPETPWEKMKRGDYTQTDATILEVVCSVGRQLAYRLEKLIDVLERGPEEEEVIFGPGLAGTPMGRLVELVRISIASYPRDHRVAVITNTGDLIATNPLPYSIPILITNTDNAQLLYYGTGIATVLNSPILDPETSLKVVLSPASDLFGIVVGANVNVAVSNLELPTV